MDERVDFPSQLSTTKKSFLLFGLWRPKPKSDGEQGSDYEAIPGNALLWLESALLLERWAIRRTLLRSVSSSVLGLLALWPEASFSETRTPNVSAMSVSFSENYPPIEISLSARYLLPLSESEREEDILDGDHSPKSCTSNLEADRRQTHGSFSCQSQTAAKDRTFMAALWRIERAGLFEPPSQRKRSDVSSASVHAQPLCVWILSVCGTETRASMLAWVVSPAKVLLWI